MDQLDAIRCVGVLIRPLFFAVCRSGALKNLFVTFVLCVAWLIVSLMSSFCLLFLYDPKIFLFEEDVAFAFSWRASIGVWVFFYVSAALFVNKDAYSDDALAHSTLSLTRSKSYLFLSIFLSHPLFYLCCAVLGRSRIRSDDLPDYGQIIQTCRVRTSPLPPPLIYLSQRNYCVSGSLVGAKYAEGSVFGKGGGDDSKVYHRLRQSFERGWPRKGGKVDLPSMDVDPTNRS